MRIILANVYTVAYLTIKYYGKINSKNIHYFIFFNGVNNLNAQNSFESVHIGIQPEIEVNYTQKDIFEGKDPILLKGVEVIKTGKQLLIKINSL